MPPASESTQEVENVLLLVFRLRIEVSDNRVGFRWGELRVPRARMGLCTASELSRQIQKI